MTVIRYVFQLVIGLFFGGLSYLALIPLQVAFPSYINATVGTGIAGLIALVVAPSPSLRQAFGRSFLLLGLCICLLPLSASAFSGAFINEVVAVSGEADKDAAVWGPVVSGILVSTAGVFGFMIGGTFAVIGLVLMFAKTRTPVTTNT